LTQLLWFQLGESPLHESLRLGHVNSAQLLLRCGASANVTGPCDVTPLMLACMDARAGGTAMVETLLDYEADPELKDQKGWTAMRSVTGNSQCAEALLF
jgi:ankyrin repeat protein